MLIGCFGGKIQYLDSYIISSIFLVKGGKVVSWLGGGLRDFDVWGKYHSEMFSGSINFIKISGREMIHK